MSPRVLIAYIVLSLVWGTTWIVLKISLDGTPPIFGVALRFSISAAILWGYMLLRGQRPVMTPIAIRLYLVFGLINVTVCYPMTYWGTQYVHSGMSAILWATLPLFTAFAAHFAIAEDRLTLLKVAGGLLGLGGTFLIFYQPNGDPHELRMIGIGVILISVLLACWPNIYYKKNQASVPPLHLNVVGQSIGALMLYPIAFIFEDPGAMVWSAQNVGALVYLAVFGTVVAWSIYLWLYAHLSVTQITAIALLPPIVALLLGWVFLDETLSSSAIAGSALVLGGVLLVNLKRGAKARPQDEAASPSSPPIAPR